MGFYRRAPFTPRAEIVYDSPGVLRRWTVVVSRTGSTYRATTYPNSELIYLETGAKGRVVAPGVGRKLHPIVRAAIARALTDGEAVALERFHAKQKEYGYED